MDFGVESLILSNIPGVVAGTGSGIMTAVKSQLVGSAGATSIPTPNALVALDNNANLSVANFKTPATNTVSSGGILSLTVTSNSVQTISGTLNHTVVLPVSTTLTKGFRYNIINNSTGIVTVQDAAGGVICSILQNTTGNGSRVFTCANNNSVAGIWQMDVSSVDGRLVVGQDVQIGTIKVRLAIGTGYLVTSATSGSIILTMQTRLLAGVGAGTFTTPNIANVTVTNVTPLAANGIATIVNSVNNWILADLFDTTNGKTYDLRVLFTPTYNLINLSLKA